jgi:hypothetical protein
VPAPRSLVVPKTAVTAASPDAAEQVTLTQSKIRADTVASLVERTKAIVDQLLKSNIEDATSCPMTRCIRFNVSSRG